MKPRLRLDFTLKWRGLLLGLAFTALTLRAATFTVINTNVTGPGSLQQALFDANTNAGADVIEFNILSGGLRISPTNALPLITEPVILNGRSQPGYVSSPIIEISGGSAGSATDGLRISTTNCQVSALVINGFLGDGIEIIGGSTNTVEGCFVGLNVAGTADAGNSLNGILLTGAPWNVIGGNDPTNRNYIAGNNQHGINISTATSSNNYILGNVIGLNLTNGAVPNSVDGLRVTGPFTVIGGLTSVSRNIISGNTGDGIQIDWPGTNAAILGNYIGTDSTGTLDRGNTGDGVLATCGGARIGGSSPGEGNVISGNNATGIELSGLNSTNHVVEGNLIGVSANGQGALMNNLHGILITTSSRSNRIGGVLSGEGNIIAYNGADGISVAAAAANTNNTFRGNSIFSNGTTAAHLGIDLGADNVQANDMGDSDAGANQLQNFPVLGWATNTPGEVTISGSLPSRPSTEYLLDFYSNTASDASGNGEGQEYLGSTNLTTGTDSNGIFVVTLSVSTLTGRYITATATDPYGNTSEFATNVWAHSTVPGTTFTVINTNSAGSGSLRQAILDANANVSVGDTIAFAITNLSTTITPAPALPAITDPVTIDGYTQSGSATNTSATAFNGLLRVRLAGTSAGNPANGLTLVSGNTTVRGLLITGFQGTTGDGIEISGPGGNVIEGNIIGLDAAAADQGNSGNGVLISGSSGNRVGGDSPGARNVLSGNGSDGIEISGAASRDNLVYGNLIGTDFTGSSNRNNTANGVFVTEAGRNVIGGPASGQGNLISANQSDGIELSGPSATNNVVQGNRIGVDAVGTDPLGNSASGVFITSNSRSNVIGGVNAGEGNLIAFNNADGISIAAANSHTNNLVRGNAIHSNTDLGIDLGASGVQPNDAGDVDTGANQLQNHPVLLSADNSSAGTTISGSLHGRPSTAYTVEFFGNVTPETTGYGEGQYYLGAASVTTGADSNALFTVSLPVTNLPGRYVTATATDPFGNTSEFGPSLFASSTIAGSTFTVTNVNDSGPGSLRQAILDANANVSAGDTIAFSIPSPGVQTIYLTNQLPVITDPVTIDGTTQPGAFCSTSSSNFNGNLLIKISGTNLFNFVTPYGYGLRFTTSSNIMRGLIIVDIGGDAVGLAGGNGNVIECCLIGIDENGQAHGNYYSGIWLTGSCWNRLGGSNAAARNVISANAVGILLEDTLSSVTTSASSNVITGNLIGTDLAGSSARGNYEGISIHQSSYNQIGGATPGERNVISGNSFGVFAEARWRPVTMPAEHNWVAGNYFGTDCLGTRILPNNEGIVLGNGAMNTLIGGTNAGEGNLISGNTYGVIVSAGDEFIYTNRFTRILGNRIGVDVTGTNVLANVIGVQVMNRASHCTIGGTDPGAANIIAHNTSSGVAVLEQLPEDRCTNVTIRANLIYGNYSAGIALSGGGGNASVNDPGDPDLGPNYCQNFPVLGYVTNTPGETLISGLLNSHPSTTYTLDFYANPEPHTSGLGEGRFHLGSTNVTTHPDGDAFFTVSLPIVELPGRYVCATATDPYGNTSQFGSNTLAHSTRPGVTFTVVNTNDTGPGSLRAAILAANSQASARDIIAFAITNLSTTIAPASALPALLDAVVINGSTQPGFAGVPLVELDGSNAGAVSGLSVSWSNCVIRSLVINRFGLHGIDFFNARDNQVEGCYIGLDDDGASDAGNALHGVWFAASPANLIGGSALTNRNFISGNTETGIEIADADSIGNRILGNVIGLNVTNAAVPNTGGGVSTLAGLTVIGANGDGNVISGNLGNGVTIAAPATNTIVQGNFIGTDPTGALGMGNSQDGLWISASHVSVGGGAPGEGNVISANGSDGIELTNLGEGGSARGNIIGADVSGTLPLGNGSHGINYSSYFGHTAGGIGAGEGNLVAFNGSDGISVTGGSTTNITLRGNTIFSNGTSANHLGIDVGSGGTNPNDAGDADFGANGLQNHPVLLGATNTPIGTDVTGTLHSRPNTTYALDFYANAAPDTSGYGEGRYYLGSTNVTTGADSNALFVATLAVTNLPGRYLTATATDPYGNTSEFGTNVYVLRGDALEPPTLAVSISGSQITLSWPSATSGLFGLQTTTNLTPVIVWTSVTNTVSENGTNKQVILTPLPAEPARFYRLYQP